MKAVLAGIDAFTVALDLGTFARALPLEAHAPRATDRASAIDAIIGVAVAVVVDPVAAEFLRRVRVAGTYPGSARGRDAPPVVPAGALGVLTAALGAYRASTWKLHTEPGLTLVGTVARIEEAPRRRVAGAAIEEWSVVSGATRDEERCDEEPAEYRILHGRTQWAKGLAGSMGARAIAPGLMSRSRTNVRQVAAPV